MAQFEGKVVSPTTTAGLSVIVSGFRVSKGNLIFENEALKKMLGEHYSIKVDTEGAKYFIAEARQSKTLANGDKLYKFGTPRKFSMQINCKSAGPGPSSVKCEIDGFISQERMRALPTVSQ